MTQSKKVKDFVCICGSGENKKKYQLLREGNRVLEIRLGMCFKVSQAKFFFFFGQRYVIFSLKWDSCYTINSFIIEFIQEKRQTLNLLIKYKEMQNWENDGIFKSQMAV